MAILMAESDGNRGKVSHLAFGDVNSVIRHNPQLSVAIRRYRQNHMKNGCIFAS